MRKRRFGQKKEGAAEDMSLNITSMADIFTILLVFLLKSFSVGVSNLSPSAEIVLPEVPSAEQVKETLKIEIGPSVVLLDDKPVAVLRGFQLIEGDLTPDGTSKAITAALAHQRSRAPASASSEEQDPQAQGAGAPAPRRSTRLMVLADQRTPYSTLSAIMASAGNSGYTEIKLVVVEEQ